MNHRIDHGDVVAFGSKLNAVATHEVLPGGKGKRMSLVYEFAVHNDDYTDDRKDDAFHNHMGVKDGKFKLLPLQNKSRIKIEL